MILTTNYCYPHITAPPIKAYREKENIILKNLYIPFLLLALLFLEAGVYAFSTEVLPEFAGDYVVLSKNPEADNSFMETDVWNNIPAVKNDQVIEINTLESTYSDPNTLGHLLTIFEESFLGN